MCQGAGRPRRSRPPPCSDSSASGRNRIVGATRARIARRQPGSRTGQPRAGGGDHRDNRNIGSRAYRPAGPGHGHSSGAEAAGPGTGGHCDRAVDGGARLDHRHRRVTAHPARPRLLRNESGVGGQRLRGGVRRAAAARRAGRRPTGAPPGLHRRPRRLLPGVAVGWYGYEPGLADRRAGRSGRGRGDGCAYRTVADRGHLPGGPAAQPRRRRVLGNGHRRRRGRTRRRGPTGHLRQLAVGAVRERADRAPRRGPGHPGAAKDTAERGALTATSGVALLVYGLSNAATTPDGVSHWGDAKVVASLAAAAVLLAAFVVVEARSKNPLLPLRLLRSRDRSGGYLISFSIGAGLIGMLFFLTLFVQEVWGYSALKTAIAFLPYVPPIIVTTVLAQRTVSRIGPRPLLITGGTIAAGGMFWLSRITEHSSYAGGMLGPLLLLGTGLGLVFTPMSLVILNKVNPNDAGAASSGVNMGQQIGSSIGLAVLGTVAWSTITSNARSHAAAATKTGLHVSGAKAAALRTQIYHHALATGFSRTYLVSAGILALIVVIAMFMMRVRHTDLAGADPAPAGDTSSPAAAGPPPAPLPASPPGDQPALVGPAGHHDAEVLRHALGRRGHARQAATALQATNHPGGS